MLRRKPTRGFEMKRYVNANMRDCGNKKAYPSYRAACEMNNSLRRRGSAISHQGKKLEKLHAYKCANCRQYHLGHPPRKNQRYLAQ